jgi:hypothetical protein
MASMDMQIAKMDARERTVLLSMIADYGLSFYPDRKSTMLMSMTDISHTSLSVLNRVPLYRDGKQVKFLLPQLGRQQLTDEMWANLGYIVGDRHYSLTGDGRFIIDGIKNGFSSIKSVHFTMIEEKIDGPKYTLFCARRTIVNQGERKVAACANGYDDKTGFWADSSIPETNFWGWQHITLFKPCRQVDTILLINGLEYIIPTEMFGVEVRDDGAVWLKDKKFRERALVRPGYYLSTLDGVMTPVERYHHWVADSSFVESLNRDSSGKFDEILLGHIFPSFTNSCDEPVIPAGSQSLRLCNQIKVRTGRKVCQREKIMSLVEFFMICGGRRFSGHDMVKVFLEYGSSLDFPTLRHWITLTGGYMMSSQYVVGKGPILRDDIMVPYMMNFSSFSGSICHGSADAPSKLIEEIAEFKAEVSEDAFDELGDVVNCYVGSLLEHNDRGLLGRHKELMAIHFPKSYDKIASRAPQNLSTFKYATQLKPFVTMPHDRKRIPISSTSPLVRGEYKGFMFYLENTSELSPLPAINDDGTGSPTHFYRHVGFEHHPAKRLSWTWRYSEMTLWDKFHSLFEDRLLVPKGSFDNIFSHSDFGQFVEDAGEGMLRLKADKDVKNPNKYPQVRFGPGYINPRTGSPVIVFPLYSDFNYEDGLLNRLGDRLPT